MGGFNGSGVYVRFYSWVTDAGNGIDISASRTDTEDNGFATGLSNCICKDGQTTITANLPMATFRHTGVGNAVARTDYAAAGQVQDGILQWIDAGGTADALTAAYSPAITALADGMQLRVRAGLANATTTPTFSPNGLTAHTITKFGGKALAAGDIAGDDHELLLVYNLGNTNWELLNPATYTNTYQATPGNPTGNATGTNVMMGLAGAITPGISGKILILISGYLQNTSTGGANAQIAYGTGTAPVNGAAATGTLIGNNATNNPSVAATAIPFTCCAIVSGLTLGTAYWIDLQLARVAAIGTGSCGNLTVSIMEIH